MSVAAEFALIGMLPVCVISCQQMDEKIPEPLGAAHTDPMGAFPAIRKAILDNWRRWACRDWKPAAIAPGAVLGPAAQPHMGRVVAMMPGHGVDAGRQVCQPH